MTSTSVKLRIRGVIVLHAQLAIQREIKPDGSPQLRIVGENIQAACRLIDLRNAAQRERLAHQIDVGLDRISQWCALDLVEHNRCADRHGERTVRRVRVHVADDDAGRGIQFVRA